MVGTRNYIRGGLSIQMGDDPARSRRTGQVTRNQLAYGIVGHEEPTPAYVEIRNGQAWVEVTMVPEGDEIVARLGLPSAGAASGWFLPVSFGCRVVLELIDGDPQGAIIVARLNDETCALPNTACGVPTGATGITDEASAPAPAWQFSVLPSGQLLGIETQGTGDVLIHAGNGMELKASGAGARIHLNGAVSLGEGPTTAPVGGTVGPNGVDAPGTPMAPAVPVPYVAVPNAVGVPVPYTGNTDGIVRAKEEHQFSATNDPVNYTKFAAVYLHPLIGLIPPVVLVSAIRGGSLGSKHTASD